VYRDLASDKGIAFTVYQEMSGLIVHFFIKIRHYPISNFSKMVFFATDLLQS